jgi:hypothetical protein
MMIAVAVVGETGRIFGWIHMLVVRLCRYWLRWMMHPQSFQHPSRSTLTTYISTGAVRQQGNFDGKEGIVFCHVPRWRLAAKGYLYNMNAAVAGAVTCWRRWGGESSSAVAVLHFSRLLLLLHVQLLVL